MMPDRTPLQELWTRMLAIYGHRWDSQYGRTPTGVAGETWEAGLEGLTPRQIGNGLDACLRATDDWPPTLPLFRARCLGIPSLVATRADVCRDAADRHPFSRMVWALVDSHAYARSDRQQADRMLRDAYDLAREQVMGGQAMPAPSRALTGPNADAIADAERELYDRLHQERLRDLQSAAAEEGSAT